MTSMGKGILSFFLLCLPILSLASQGLAFLGLEEALELALGQNSSFQTSRLDLESSQLAYENRWNILYPSFSGNVGLSYQDTAFTWVENPPGYEPTRLSMGLSLSLPLRPSLGYELDQIKLRYEERLISYETARKELLSNVAKEFHYLLTLQGNLEVLRENQRLAQRRYEQAQRDFSNGLVSELQVLQTQVTTANTLPQLSGAIQDYENRRRNFLVLLGVDPEEEVEFRGSLARPFLLLDEEAVLLTYLPKRQDIRAQQKQVEILENTLGLSKASGYIPRLSLSAGWSSGVGAPFKQETWDKWTDSFNIGMGLQFPFDGFIPGSSTQTGISQQKKQLQQGRLWLADLYARGKAEILNLNRSIQTAIEVLRQATLNVALAQRSFEATEESYSYGRTSRLDVEDAQQAYLSAVQRRLTSQYAYLVGLIDLQYALNLPSVEELISLGEVIDE